MKDITCRGADQAIYLQGLPELNLENITMENIDMTAVEGMACIDARGIKIRNMRLVTEKKPLIFFLNSSDADVTGLQVAEDADGLVEVRGSSSARITVETVTPDGTARARTLR